MLANNISFLWFLGAITITITITILLAIQIVRRQRKVSPSHFIGSPNCKETMITDLLPDGLSETGSMFYYAKHTSGDGDNKYCFNFKKTNNEWRAYIVRTPCFNNRLDDTCITHRVYDGKNFLYFISWDKPVNSLKNIQTIAKVWADNIQKYIETGKRFGE